MKPRMSGLMKKEATRSILASILSIIIGLVVGCVIILIVGMTSDTLSPSSAWDGIRLIFGGLFSTGRDAAGALTFGFNPTNIGNMLFRATPLILTGLSVAVAFKTGLFNIGAPGTVSDGHHGDPDAGAGHPFRGGPCGADLDHCLCGRLFGRCGLGSDPWALEGVSQYQ